VSYDWINIYEVTGLTNQKIILFGAGRGSEEFLQYSEKSKLRNEVISIVDNDPTYWGHHLLGYKIIPPEKIGNKDFDKIVVTSISGRETIARQLEGMGFKQDSDYILAGRYPQTYRGNFENLLKNFPFKPELDGARCLHIGPGGFLGLEILLYCFGTEKVYSIDNLPFDIRFPDISDLVEDYEGVKETLIDIIGDEALRKDALYRYDDLFVRKGDRIFIDSNKIEFIHPMDMCRMNYESNSFDLVISFSVLEHVLKPEAAISEVARCLKPGGICYHTVITQDHRSFSKVGNKGPFSYRKYSSTEWKRIAENRFYQNRLLPVEWKCLHKKNSLNIKKYRIENRFEFDDRTFDTFHSDFKCFSKQELNEADCMIVAQKEMR
jgi:SAM-dependent methyltransferase